MRKISLLIVLLFLTFFLGTGVLAQDTEFKLPEAGITPESPFYFLDRFGEFLQEFFTFNPEGKARLQITFAAERIAEIKLILKTKGVEAKGLDIAQSRLQAHLAKAVAIIASQKEKGEDVTVFAQELDDEFEGPNSALVQVFKEQKRTLKTRKDELKTQLRVAHQAGDTVLEEAIASELGQVMGQLELLKVREKDIKKELEEEEERIEEEMEVQHKAEEAIREAGEELKKLQEEAVEEGVEIPVEALAEFNNLLSQAKTAFDADNFLDAKHLAKQAEEFLEQAEEVIEELEEEKEAKEESGEAIQDAEEELKEIQEKATEEGVAISAEALIQFNSLLSQAKSAFAVENYKEAKRLAERAEEALKDVEKTIEQLKEEKEEVEGIEGGEKDDKEEKGKQESEGEQEEGEE